MKKNYFSVIDHKERVYCYNE